MFSVKLLVFEAQSHCDSPNPKQDKKVTKDDGWGKKKSKRHI